MNFASIAYVLGTLLVVTGCAMVAPAICAAIYNEGDLPALVWSAVISVALGLPLRLRYRHGNVLATRDAIIIAAFGFGWTPCIGPVLSVILGVAGTEETVGSGAILLATYSLGLGLPFIAAGLHRVEH